MLSFNQRMEILKAWRETSQLLTLDQYIETVLPNYGTSVQKAPEPSYPKSIIPKNYSGYDMSLIKAKTDDRIGKVVHRFENFYYAASDELFDCIAEGLELPLGIPFYDAVNAVNVY